MQKDRGLIKLLRKDFFIKKEFNTPTVFLITGVFFLLCLIGILHHAMWRDELQAWSLARDSGSLPEMFRALHYEYHTCLWYLMLYGLVKWTSNPFAMQFVHILIASLSIFIFLRSAPFNRIYKILFIFGYFPFYEYAIKSRDYALGVLIIFIICSLWKDRLKNYLFISIWLFLLCQVSLFGWIIAFILGAMLVAEYFAQKNPEIKPSAGKNPYFALIFFVLGLIMTIWQILPIPKSPHYAFNVIRAAKIVCIIFKTYFQSADSHWFGTITFDPFNDGCLYLILSILVFLFFLISFLNKKEIFFLYLISNFVFLASFFKKFYGLPWHHGYLFILLIVCLWLEEYYPPSKIQSNFLAGINTTANKIKPLLLSIILICQMVAGIKSYALDITVPYSAAKETAQFIETHGFMNTLMVGDADFAASTVAGYLDKKIYYPKSKRFGTYMIWYKKKSGTVGITGTLLAAKELMDKNKQDIMLILNYQPNENDLPFYVQKIIFFTTSIWDDEKYYLYIVKYRLYQNPAKLNYNQTPLE